MVYSLLPLSLRTTLFYYIDFMSLKLKSILNKESAELLLKDNKYAPSVHCSYYSCIQFMLFLIYGKLKVTNTDFEIRRKEVQKGTHQYAISLILDHLNTLKYEKDGKDNLKFFKTKISELKLLRELSDYKDVMIDNVQGDEAYDLSNGINGILNRLQ